MKTILAVLAGFALGVGASWISGFLPKEEGSQQAEASKPAYMIVLGDVLNEVEFAENYAQHVPALYQKYGGTYLGLGELDSHSHLEGEARPSAFVLARWENKAAAKAFWTSEEYVALREARIENNWGDFDVYLLDGLAPN